MNCLFCKIVQKEIPSHIIAENENIIVILDIDPVSDGHSLLISKEHFSNITEVDEKTWIDLLPFIKKITDVLQKKFNSRGFNIITNVNEISYQTIFHFHLHIIPKYEIDKGFVWTSNKDSKKNLNLIAEKIKEEF